MAGTKHKHSIIFRRVFPSLRGLIERSRDIYDAHGRYNGQDHLWRLKGNRLIEFGSVQYEDDKKNQQGQPRDFMVFDEAAEFTESIVRWMMAWNRTTDKRYKAQTMLTFNPPTSVEGQWIIRFFAPWIGDKPTAKPGEILWFTADEKGKEMQVESGEPFIRNGEEFTPRSRTFFPAKVTDNPHWKGTGYISTLQGLPEPMRSQMLYGDMKAGAKDDAWQCIPSAWLRAAMDRWQPRESPGLLTCLGVDVARGGDDATVLAPRYGSWFAELESTPGKDTPTGGDVLRLMFPHLINGGYANVDCIGVGSAVVDLAAVQGAHAIPVNFAEASDARDRTGYFGFANKRAEAYWGIRELLDPDRPLEPGEEPPMIPPDDELFTDLTAARYEPTPRGVKIEPKDAIKERIGRSPDRGDALALAVIMTGGMFDATAWTQGLADMDKRA